MPRTSPRVRLILVLLSVAVLGFTGVIVWVRHSIPPEPVFNGKPLTHWMTLDRWADSAGLGADDLRSLGPDGLRWLIYTARTGRLSPRAQSTGLRRHWDALVQRIRYRVNKDAFLDDIREDGAVAMRYLRLLGPDAAPAIPAMVQIIEKADVRDFAQNLRAEEAAHVLATIGPLARPEYRRLTSTRPPEVRDQLVLIYTMWSRPPPASEQDAALILDILMSASRSPNEEARHKALVGIAKLCRDHGFRPAMKAALADAIDFISGPKTTLPLDLPLMLGTYGREASAAIPALVKLLDAPDPDLASGAAVALTMIDPADERAILCLRRLLSSPRSAFAAADQLKRFGGTHRHVAALVRKVLSSPDPGIDQIVRSYLQLINLAPAAPTTAL